MKYEALVRDVPQNEVEIVKMNDGSLIQCKKIPLATIENMDTIFGGVKRALDTTKDSLNYIATCGSTKLYSAAGDVSTYMKGKNGNILSASIGKNGKISGQPGFKEVEMGAEGVKAATTIAKAIPYIAFAVMVIEVGTKIVLNQKAMKEKQIEMYDKISEINEDNINNLWQAMNDFTLYKGDEAHRIASVMKITNALDESRNSLRKLSKEANNGEPINDHLVYAMKTALDVYSFSYLLNIMYSKVDDSTNLIENARKSISEQTLVYNDILDRCHNQYVESRRKHSKLLDNTQYDNTNKSKEYVAKRVAINVLTGGLAELGSLGSKKIGQKVEKNDEEILKRLEECKKMENPYAQCIENAGELLFLEKPVLRDDKYLYYQVG